MNFQTAEELRYYVTKDSIGSKLKFAAKLFIILDFTNHNPLLVNITGTTWLKDGVRFITNSQIFGQFINLRPNSVNANFRSHFFKILHCSSAQIRKEALSLSDPTNYKIRSNLTYHFTISSTMEQINSIPCDMPALQQLKIAHNSPQMNIPDFIYTFLKSGEKEFLLNTELLYTRIKRKNEWKDRFFDLALKEWKSFAGEQIVVDISDLLRFITTDLNSQICRNISFLLNQFESSSPTDETISFDVYVRFVLQYGFLNQCLSGSVFDLSVINTDSPISANDISENGELYPKFKKWFKPNFNENTATSYLSRKPNNTWIVRPSKSIGKFTLHLKRLQGSMATHIFFDPLNHAESFMVEVENGNELRASSWEEILSLMKVPTAPVAIPNLIQPPLPFLQHIRNSIQPFANNATIVIYPNQSGVSNTLNSSFYTNGGNSNADNDDESAISNVHSIYVNAKEIIGPDTLLKDAQAFKPIPIF